MFEFRLERKKNHIQKEELARNPTRVGLGWVGRFKEDDTPLHFITGKKMNKTDLKKQKTNNYDCDVTNFHFLKVQSLLNKKVRLDVYADDSFSREISSRREQLFSSYN